MSHKITAAATALCMAFLVVGTVDAKSFRWSSQGDVGTLDPHAQNNGLTNSINVHLYDRLILRNKKLEPIPGLALSWQQTSPTVWIVKLRQGVKFHDGSPFTADDVVFSIERAQTPPSNQKANSTNIGKPRKIDDYTVEFTTPSPNPVMVGQLGSIAIMSKTWAVKNKAERSQDFAAKEESFASRNANGTGPFILVSREPDVKTVFKKNPNWWGIAEKRFEGNIDEFIYIPLKSDSTRMAALQSGEIDFVLDPPLQNIEQLRKDPALKVYDLREDRVIFFCLDLARDELLYSSVKGKNPFKDKRVRQAMYQAIDIETIKKQVMRGLALPTGALLPNPDGAGVPTAMQKRLPFDLAAAKKLMVEAGYPNGFDVTLDCPNNRYVNDERICVATAAMLAKIDINVAVNAKPVTQWNPKGLKRDTSFIMLGWGGVGGDPDAHHTFGPVWHSPDGKSYGEYNFGGVKDEALDKLIEAQAIEIDPVKRQQIILEAVKLHDENIYRLPLHLQFIPWASRANVSVSPRSDNYLLMQWVTKN